MARDLRDSSPRIAGDVIAAARAAGLRVTDCGATSTPALALAAQSARAAAVMVTGSHIPADRNGLKFYTPAGEITKAEEAAILAALDHPPSPAREAGPLHSFDPGPGYVARIRTAYGPSALAGQRLGVWSHSAVGRDLLIATLRALGGAVIEIGRAETFVPIDTEAVSAESRGFLVAAAAEHGLSAIASTDGDGDRPLLADATGRIVPGDVLGQIAARTLGAQVVVTPVSSNTGVAQMGFAQVIRTKIGSPFVIAGMEAAEAGGAERVVGYEANGGFLLGFDAHGLAGPLPRLLTRDSHLPIVAALSAAGAGGLAALVAQGPQRFTAADRLQEVPTARTTALVAALAQNPAALLTPLEAGELQSLDQTDGLRLTLTSGRIVHLRPSGNAPELRLYAEAERADVAQTLLANAMTRVLALL